MLNYNSTCNNIIINSNQYTQFTNEILANYKNNNKQPAKIHTTFGQITFNDTVLLLTRIVNNFNQNKKFPEKIKIESLSGTTNQILLEYTITVPCYINTTLKQVIQTNNKTYNDYIVKLGENGLIKIPTIRIINITIPQTQKTYTFTNKYLDDKYHNLATSAAFITIGGNNKVNCSKNYKTINQGILIYNTNDNIIIKYTNLEKEDINQFGILFSSDKKIYSTECLPRLNSTLFTEKISINTNKLNNVLITFTE